MGQATKPVTHRLNERLFMAIAARKRTGGLRPFLPVNSEHRPYAIQGRGLTRHKPRPAIPAEIVRRRSASRSRTFGKRLWEPDELIGTLGLNPKGNGGAGVRYSIVRGGSQNSDKSTNCNDLVVHDVRNVPK